MKEELIAPCGLNCAVCRYYLPKTKGLYRSDKSGCTGCIPRGEGCKLNNACEPLRQKQVRFCFGCESFPCEILQKLEKRYSTKYHTSLIENLKKIQEKGIESFLNDETEKWKCPVCGGTISMHTGTCFDCGKSKNL